MSTVTSREIMYLPKNDPTWKVLVFGIIAIILFWAIAAIAPIPTIGKVGLVGLVIFCVITFTWLVNRHWKAHHQRNAAMRQAFSQALGVSIPENMPGRQRRSLVAMGFHFGSLREPGPPRKIVLRGNQLPPVGVEETMKLQASLMMVEGQVYTLGKRSKRDKIVLIEKPPQKDDDDDPEPELSFREQAEVRFAGAAKEIFGDETKVTYAWDTDQDGVDYLLEADITCIKASMDLSLSGKRNQIARKLRSQLPDQGFHFDAIPNEDRMRFYRVKPLPHVVFPPAARKELMTSHKDYEDFVLELGIGSHDRVATWSPRRDAHLMIIGGTGGGKTIQLHGVIQKLAQAGWRVWLIDGKETELPGYQDYSNVEYLAQEIDSQIRLLRLAVETMDARRALIRERKARIADLEPIVVVIDELTEVFSSGEERYEEVTGKRGKTNSPLPTWVGRLARLARSFKIHLVIGLQRPDARILAGEIRDNFGGRVSAGALESKEGSMMMWKGDPAIGVQVPDIKGRGVALIQGVPTQVQLTYTANPDDSHPDYHRGMVEAAYPAREVYTTKRILAPTPTGASKGKDGDETYELQWDDLLEAEIVDANGQQVIFDPVASEEARRLRSNPPGNTTSQDPADHHLQPAESFSEGMALFPDPGVEDLIEQLEFGKELAQGILRLDCPAAEETTETPAEQAPVPANTAPAQEMTFTCPVDELKPGQYALLEQAGAEIMISEIEHTGGAWAVSGYTNDGEFISIEVEEGATVESRQGPEAADELVEEMDR